ALPNRETHGETKASISQEMDSRPVEARVTLSRKGSCRHAPSSLANLAQSSFPIAERSWTGAGEATFNGTTIGAWWFARDSLLSFSGPGVAIPNSTNSFITITTPFTMTGSVFVHTLDDFSHPIVFSTTVSGSGIATLTFTMSQVFQPGSYIFSNVRYDFAPVPEPGTLLLFSTSLIGAVVALRRKRRSGKA